MKRLSLFWKIYPAFILVSLLSLVAVTIISCLSFKSFYYQQREFDLELKARIVAPEFSILIKDSNLLKIQQRSHKLGEDIQTRYTIINLEGKVIGDSQKRPSEMDNHKNRSEVLDSLKNGKGTSIRYSNTLKKKFMYHALLIFTEEGHRLGVIRTATPLSDIRKTLVDIYQKVIISFFLLLLIVSIISWKISKWLSSPLTKMKVQATKLAQGDFTSKIELNFSDTIEFFELGQAINEISVQLNKTIATITNQNNEQRAVFSSMVEGIMAFDLEQRIIKLNDAACRILEVSTEEAEGKLLENVIGNLKFQEFLDSSLKNTMPASEEITFFQGSEPRYISLKLGPLFDIKKEKCGVVVIFNDITKIKELEQHRKDFVANVSHELRTPLTNIQGFAETLLNPSVKSEEDRLQFVNIIHKHATRLGVIIEDLLTLSRVEKETEQNEVKLEKSLVKPVLENAIFFCSHKAEKRKMEIIIDCPVTLTAMLNSALFEQAIVNLLDNSIKYGNENSKIRISGKLEDNAIVIVVKDEGAGIEKEHLERLFERFYRVDKARSRQVGGTGLGLSIVKHISLAHKGTVRVQSQVNQGCVFKIYLPL